ncbi:MAG TPA: hypothetical protein IAC41_08995 [Candidatus Merdenecus merdavium]|nr:hypothetical protein [Candidatus Merdenecus merdavium]
MYTDDDSRYSLCLNFPGKNGQLLLYRIADFDPDERKFLHAQYTDYYDTEYTVYDPVIIGANPADLVKYRVEIRKWIQQEGYEKRQWSYSYSNGLIFEMFSPSELLSQKNLDKKKIRENLLKGIKLPEYISDKFLLIVRDTGNEYEALYCAKSDFIKKDGLFCINECIKDMLHTKHTFDIYSIKKSKTVNTKGLFDALDDTGVFDEIRYFYSEVELPAASGSITLRNADAYVSIFLKWFLKQQKDKFAITKKEIDRTISVMEQAKENDKLIVDFLKNTGMSQNDLKQALENNADKVIEYTSSNDEYENIIERILLNDEEEYEICLEIIRNRWMNSSSEERISIEKELNEKRLAINNETNKLNDIIHNQKQIQEQYEQTILKSNTQIADLQKKLETLNKECEEVNKRKKLTVAEINEELMRFKHDIVHVTELIGVVETVKGNVKIGITDTPSRILVKEAKSFSKNTEYSEDVKDLQDFASDLSDNIAINFDQSLEITATMLSAMLNDKVIIAQNSILSELAISVSALIDEMTPFVVDLSDGGNLLLDVIKEINESKTRTVVIEGLLDRYDETVFSSICRACDEKYLFFGISQIESLSLLSRSIYNLGIVLDVEPLLRFSSCEAMWVGKYDPKAYTILYNEKCCQEYYSTFLGQSFFSWDCHHVMY